MCGIAVMAGVASISGDGSSEAEVKKCGISGCINQ